jgi:hypothetical protein
VQSINRFSDQQIRDTGSKAQEGSIFEREGSSARLRA